MFPRPALTRDVSARYWGGVALGFGVVPTDYFRRIIFKSNVGMQLGGGGTPPLRRVSVHTVSGDVKLKLIGRFENATGGIMSNGSRRNRRRGRETTGTEDGISSCMKTTAAFYE
jgi:hypothetical protein